MLSQKEKVDITLIGGSKCGTSYIYKLLKSSKNVITSVLGKETNIFLQTHHRSDYNNKDESLRSLDASPKYSELIYAHKAAKHAYQNNKEMKIIFVARNPLDRIPSMFKQCLFSGHHTNHELYRPYSKYPMPFDFSKALRDYPILLESNKYASILGEYLNYFPREQIYIDLYENLVADECSFVRELGDFLSLDDLVPLSQLVNSSSTRLYPNKYFEFLYGENLKFVRSVTPGLLKKSAQYFLKTKEPKISVKEQDKHYIISRLTAEIERFFEISNICGNACWHEFKK